MNQLESALLVEVPDVEPFVAHIRATHDPVSRRGIPAHITVLYPFVPPPELSADVLDAVRGLFTEVAPFEFSLTDVRRFGDTTVYLGLGDDASFRALTARTVRRFPDYPPYGGAFAEVTPHLTLGDSLTAGEVERLLASSDVQRIPLPISGRTREATLMVERDDGWHVAERFPFHAGSP